MPQSWSTALPRHEKYERWRRNKDTTNATYEITEERKKEEWIGKPNSADPYQSFTLRAEYSFCIFTKYWTYGEDLAQVNSN